ncbi:PspC domain-containing protein [Candidatus Daviesbacteria bacterium]|nr:PspC domain-containing protein [Candidatus Daviesbacteria bacterium]
MKKLYRSEKNKVWLGVLGGLGEYFNVDPVILRIGFILIFVFTGFVPAFIAYLLAAAIMPTKTSKPA